MSLYPTTLQHSNCSTSLNSSLSMMNADLFAAIMGFLLFGQNLGHIQAFLLAFAHSPLCLLNSFSMYLHGSLPHFLEVSAQMSPYGEITPRPHK